MQDVNGDGLPNDEWYELKGSEYGKPETIQDYAVTYFRPGLNMDTPWQDNKGNTGAIADKEAYEKQYQVFCKLLKASRKEVPLSEIIDCIERIVVMLN